MKEREREDWWRIAVILFFHNFKRARERETILSTDYLAPKLALSFPFSPMPFVTYLNKTKKNPIHPCPTPYTQKRHPSHHSSPDPTFPNLLPKFLSERKNGNAQKKMHLRSFIPPSSILDRDAHVTVTPCKGSICSRTPATPRQKVQLLVPNEDVIALRMLLLSKQLTDSISTLPISNSSFLSLGAFEKNSGIFFLLQTSEVYFSPSCLLIICSLQIIIILHRAW